MRSFIKFKMIHQFMWKGERSQQVKCNLCPCSLFAYLLSFKNHLFLLSMFYKINSHGIILSKYVHLLHIFFHNSQKLVCSTNEVLNPMIICKLLISIVVLFWFLFEDLYKKLTFSKGIIICSKEPDLPGTIQ